jgi:YidC/Oxa1 family membrane protein insertase
MMQSQDPEGQKNLMLAIGLSVAVLLLWQVFYGAPKLKEEQENMRRQKEVAEQAALKPGAAASSTPGVIPTPGGPTAAPSAAQAGVAPAISRTAALEASPRALIETEKLRGSVNLKGARIDDLVLPKYRERVELNSPPVTLMSPAETAAPFFAETGWSAAPGTTAKLPDRDTIWTTAPGARLTSKTPLVLTSDNGQGLVFKRTIALDEHYLFTITDEVENKTAAEIKLYPYGRLFREKLPKVEGLIAHEGPYGAVGADKLTEITYYDAQKPTGQKLFENAVGFWAS